MSINVKVNSSLRGRADEAARKAAEATFRELFQEFQRSLDYKAWNWPWNLPTRGLGGDTLTKKLANYNAGKGKLAGNPRNINDFGTLGQSGSWQMTGPYSAQFKWSAKYATAVHEGATIRAWGNESAPRDLPARPWTSAVLGRVQVPGIKPFPLEQRLRDVWLARFKASR